MAFNSGAYYDFGFLAAKTNKAEWTLVANIIKQKAPAAELEAGLKAARQGYDDYHA